jgi:hypothetical protein
MKQAAKRFLLLSALLLDLGLSFDSQDGGTTFLRNIAKLLLKTAVLHPRRKYFLLLYIGYLICLIN